MATQYGIKYAVHIISSHFGNLVAKVCECLLKKGPLALPDLVRFTGISDSQVKNCLLVLIQQNCVQAFVIDHQGGPGNESKHTTEYMALFVNIIHRMRFSKFLAVVSQEFDNRDKECVDLFEVLLQHGRLTFEKMVDIAKLSQENSKAEEAARERLTKLANAHFVERCPAPAPHLTPLNEEETPAKKQRPEYCKVDAEPRLVERVLAAADPMESERFLVNEIDGETTDDNSPGTGEKRKHKVLESESDLGTVGKQEVLWHVNYEEFLDRFRHKACIDKVREHLDEGAATVLCAILQATQSREKKVSTETSAPLSINTIFEEVKKVSDGCSMTLDRVRASLVLLGCVEGADDSYQIDLKNIIDLAQNEEVESIVLKRYGKDAYRIFRFLSKANRPLETDKFLGSYVKERIAQTVVIETSSLNTAFVDKKETPGILHRLWKDEFLHLEKIVVRGTRQLQFLLWKVNKPTLWQNVLDEMHHAASTLSQRVAFVLEKENELIVRAIEETEGDPVEKRKNQLANVGRVLQSSLMNLDDSLMLFHDF